MRDDTRGTVKYTIQHFVWKKSCRRKFLVGFRLIASVTEYYGEEMKNDRGKGIRNKN